MKHEGVLECVGERKKRVIVRLERRVFEKCISVMRRVSMSI